MSTYRRAPNAEPAPFVWVPIPSGAPKRSAPQYHHAFSGLTGKLELTITVESDYLFVGSGEFDAGAKGDGPDVWSTFFRRNGQICIPGTSIKGAIRAIVEAISNSCVSQKKRDEKLDDAHAACRDANSLCPACRLFGVTGYRGRVHFSDALPEGQVPTPEVIKIAELWGPRLSRGRKFYQVKKVASLPDRRPQKGFHFVEAVPKGTRFHTVLHFENLTEEELGLLLYALGWEPQGEKLVVAFSPKLGGAKPRCFGAVRFGYGKLTLWEGQSGRIPSFKTVAPGEVSKRLVQLMNRARQSGLLHLPSWETLKKGMREQEDATCPSGAYREVNR